MIDATKLPVQPVPVGNQNTVPTSTVPSRQNPLAGQTQNYPLKDKL